MRERNYSTSKLELADARPSTPFLTFAIMKPVKHLLLVAVAITNIFLTNLNCAAQKVNQPPTQETWTKEFEPFRIAGNLYYVGTYELACYLITTPNGNILINTGCAESVPMIRAHIEKLGFKFADTKILLTNHAHFDHVGGMAEIKRITGANLMVDESDAQVMADGGNSDFLFGGKGALFAPVKPDRLLHDHDTIKLGGMNLVMLHHPGHTKGACSYLFSVRDDRRYYRVLIANMPTILDETKLSGMPTYPAVGKDYAYTLTELKKLKFDIWLAPHSSQFRLQDKHKPGDGYHPEAFFDQRGYDALVDELQKKYEKRLNNPL